MRSLQQFSDWAAVVKILVWNVAPAAGGQTPWVWSPLTPPLRRSGARSVSARHINPTGGHDVNMYLHKSDQSLPEFKHSFNFPGRFFLCAVKYF